MTTPMPFVNAPSVTPFQPAEIQTPFSLSPDGTISATPDPAVQARQHITSLVSTSLSERVMLPDYGVDIVNQLFHPDIDLVNTVLQQDISTAAQRWEPHIFVKAINPVQTGDSGHGISRVDVDFTTISPNSKTTTLTATVLVGGQVITNESTVVNT